MCEKDSHSSSSKHRDKPCSDRGSKDKESSKSPQKHVSSLSQRLSSTEWAEKEPHLEGPSRLLMPPPRVGTAVPLDTSVRQATRLLLWAPTVPLLPTRLKVDHVSDQSPVIAGIQ